MATQCFCFELQAVCPATGARAGVLHTPHGSVQTPVFMPVGTNAAVKTLTPAELHSLSARIILANTYHLYLRPGHEIVRAAGGLHRFMGWDKPILTDSGGFQVFSLSNMRSITDGGVKFKSHIDGSAHFLTPESATQIQHALGADIIMAFDECSPADADYSTVKKAMKRTIDWLSRCVAAHDAAEASTKQALFPIIQGGVFKDLRIESARRTIPYAKHGIAVGGLSVGEPLEVMLEMLDTLQPVYPVNMPRYLMGVGSPDYLVEAVRRGIDMADCVLPTRTARMGTALTLKGSINLRNARFKTDFAPVEQGCTCYCCANFSRAYVRHLIHAGEILGGKLLSIHNLHVVQGLMDSARRAVLENTFPAFYKNFKETFAKKLKV